MIGVLTSGGDSQGMNAAVRSVVRMALYHECRVYFIADGYQGMIDDKMSAAHWMSVCDITHDGGTVIGSARCPAFRKSEGRLLAAMNLIKRGINSLVVIGGDGSLTGAHLFRKEWPELVKKLLDGHKITAEQAAACAYL